MSRLKIFLLTALIALTTSCASSSSEQPDRPISELYAEAHQKLQHQEFREAIKQLEIIDNRYPYGPYAAQVQLDLLCAYYQAGDWALAQTISERFLRLNANHPQIDYVLYMRALAALAIDDNPSQRLCKIDRTERDNHSIQQAFQDFKRLIILYPNSLYATAAWQQLPGIKNYLARHELAVADYYHRRGAYVAVVNRINRLLTQFPDTSSARQGLILLQHAYQKLQLQDLAQQAQRLHEKNQQVFSQT